MRNKTLNAGFTLIELLVVISIIGLLASVSLVAFSSARDKARYTKILGDLNQIGKAAEMAYDDIKDYAPDVGRNTLPPSFSKYLSIWPKPPCSGWSYDWEYWTTHAIRITVRNTAGTAIYFYCVKPIDADCGVSYNGGTDIQNVSSKAVICSG